MNHHQVDRLIIASRLEAGEICAAVRAGDRERLMPAAFGDANDQLPHRCSGRFGSPSLPVNDARVTS